MSALPWATSSIVMSLDSALTFVARLSAPFFVVTPSKVSAGFPSTLTTRRNLSSAGFSPPLSPSLSATETVIRLLFVDFAVTR